MANYKKHATVATVAAMIFFILGLIWIIYGVWGNMKIRRIAGWPKANGTVIVSSAEPYNLFSTRTILDPSSISMIGNEALYSPKVQYKYQVGGREYLSDNLTYRGYYVHNALETRAILAAYRPGAAISVYYNPSNHSEAYINNGRLYYAGIWLGLFCWLIAAILSYHHAKVQKMTKTVDVTLSDDIKLTDYASPTKRVTIDTKTAFNKRAHAY